MKGGSSHSVPVVLLKPVAELKDDEAQALVSILNEDAALKEWLYRGDAPALTLEEFRCTSLEWQEKHDGVTYCILAPGPVGQISLSRIHEAEARIGYWLASREWNKGVAAEAFRQMLVKVKELGLREVSASIEADNRASLRLWDKFGAQQEPVVNRHIRVKILIERIEV